MLLRLRMLTTQSDYTLHVCNSRLLMLPTHTQTHHFCGQAEHLPVRTFDPIEKCGHATVLRVRTMVLNTFTVMCK